MKKLISISLIVCSLFFTLAGCSKKTNANQIIYKDQVIKLGMEKEEVDSLLGEGDLVKKNDYTDNEEDLKVSIYNYGEIDIIYVGKTDNSKIYIEQILINGSTAETVSGINVGDSVSKLEETFKNTNNQTSTQNYYSVWYKDNKLQNSRFLSENNENEGSIFYRYYFDENEENVTSILLGII